MGAPKGNQNEAKGKKWRNAINAALELRSRKDQMDALTAIAAVLIEKAAEGDLQAIKELGDRIDGRAVQALEHSGADGEPISVSIYLPDNGRSSP